MNSLRYSHFLGSSTEGIILYNLTMMRVRITIVAVEKQQVLHILRMNL
jgi:hypothetical protein